MSSHFLYLIVFSVFLDHAVGTVNFALRKSPVQSTTLYYNKFNWVAENAVDGNSDGSNPEKSRTCSATDPTSALANHTWEVDIGFQIIVKTITVYGRTDANFEQLSGFKLYIGNKTRPWIYNQELPNITSSNETYVFKPNDAIASVISLMKFGKIIVLCEVTVEGECLGGSFSEFCNLTCGTCYAHQPCNKETGTCPLGCDQGWTGLFCKEGCERGNYGYNCNETCGKCLYGNSSCSPTDGNCTNGCIAGWQGHRCKIGCLPGKYGHNCNETCGNCFHGNTSCSTSFGHCNNGCMTGWQGNDCKKECDAGSYGLACNETCGYCVSGNKSCLHTYGQCDGGCQAGWKSETCKSECAPGTYSYNCNETCGNCLYGIKNCSTSYGHCTDGCKAGWQGDDCKKECDVGKYGYNCHETCGNCLYGNISCSTSYGHCNNGCMAGWLRDDCKTECDAGTYGFTCNQTCGYCLNGKDSCLHTYGQCNGGCQAGWKGETCKSGCERGKYGYNCNETCGHCLYGIDSCSTLDGNCTNGCIAGWQGYHCNRGTLGIIPTVDVDPNVGVIVGSVLAAVAVSIFGMAIIIVIVKNRRKKHNNERSTDNVTPAAHYVNLVVGNQVAGCKITVRSIPEKDTTFSAIEEASLQRGMPIGVTNSHNGVMEDDVPVHNVYEKLQDVTESTESAYSTIDHNRINDHKMESMETCSTFVETLQSLESALKSVEEEISVLLDQKEKLLSKELETARANKLRDKRKKKDSDKDKASTIVNFVQALQSIEGELIILEDKRKCLLGRKEILLRQELAKTTENEK